MGPNVDCHDEAMFCRCTHEKDERNLRPRTVPPRPDPVTPIVTSDPAATRKSIARSMTTLGTQGTINKTEDYDALVPCHPVRCRPRPKTTIGNTSRIDIKTPPAQRTAENVTSFIHNHSKLVPSDSVADSGIVTDISDDKLTQPNRGESGETNIVIVDPVNISEVTKDSTESSEVEYRSFMTDNRWNDVMTKPSFGNKLEELPLILLGRKPLRCRPMSVKLLQSRYKEHNDRYRETRNNSADKVGNDVGCS